MNKMIAKISKKPFVRNVVIVATGTAAAQAINMAFSPLITRLYGPETFGILGVFMAMMAILAPIAALSYPIAIVLPKSDADAKVLIRISLYVSGIIAMFLTIILVLFNQFIVDLLQIEVIAPYLFLIPLVILFSASLQVANQWLIRTKQFRITAKATFLHAIILNSAKVGIGWFNPVATVLVILATLGNALQATMLIIGANRSQRKQKTKLVESATIGELAKRHIDFPLFRAPQAFINALSQGLPVLLLASFFGPTSAGFYSIGRTVLSMPTQLIGKSVADVFYPRITEAANHGEDLTRLILKATLLLACIGIVPFGIIIAFGPTLFGFVFGSDWVVAGEYARWIALWLFFGFINRPSVGAIPVIKLQGHFLIYEIVSVIIRVLVLFMGFYFYESDVLAVMFFSLAGALLNTFLIFCTVWKSMKYYSHS